MCDLDLYKDGQEVLFLLGIDVLYGVVNEQIDEDYYWVYETSTGTRMQIHKAHILSKR